MSYADDDVNVAELVERCRSGDQAAATFLFRRYIDRLIALVRERLSDRMASRMDPEDVLQSAYRSFFSGLGHGEFSIEGADDLWGLLATITLHKLYRRVAYHSAKRRSVQREQPQARDEMMEHYPELIAELPTPSEAVAAVEELDFIMQQLAPQEREIVNMRLEGYTSEEIADRLRRSDRTVRRVMERVRDLFQRRLMTDDAS